MIDTFLQRLSNPRSQRGDTLIEVVISALLVGIIVVGTFTGLIGANHAGANERANAQAAVIAQQDEERLRGLTVKELTDLGGSTHTVAENGMCVEGSTGAWKYWSGATTTSCEAVTGFKGSTYTGTVFTVKSSAEFVSAAKEALTCETEKGTADYLQTTSSVTWPSIGKHAAVSQSSLVAVPSSGTLLVKVTNRKNEPVSGAKVEAFDPSTATTATAEETTPTSGCVIFGDLAEGNAKVVASKGNWLTKSGKTAAEQPSTTITKTKLAEVTTLTLEEPGGIEATFVNSSNLPVASSTFVASQNEMGSPAFDVGGEVNNSATTAKLENLFPYITPPSTPNPYTVYAGDCEANNPLTVGVSGATARSVQVEPGTPSPAKVEVAPVKVKIYEGSTGTTPLPSSTSAAIINTECSGAKTNNGKTVEYKHEVTIANGGLESKYEYQPYAKKLELCVVGKVVVSGTTNYYESRTKFENIAKTGFTIPAVNLGSTTKVSSTTKC